MLFGAQRLDPRFPHAAPTDLDGGEPEDRRRPGEEAADARGRVVGGPHRELVALAEPALDRRAQLLLQLPAHVEERGRAGPGVEVLVRAADGEVDAAPTRARSERRRRSGSGPRARVRRRRARLGDRRRGRRARPSDSRRGRATTEHVAPGATRARRRPAVGPSIGSRHRAAATLAEPLKHVAVGREVVGVRRRARRGSRVERGRGELEQVHGRRVADEHLAAVRAQRRPRASRSPTSTGRSIQSAPRGHELEPHVSTTPPSRSTVAAGSRPSELPSA